MSSLPFLAEYESLVRQHQEQFSPALAQLQISVDETLDHLRQQERSLVEPKRNSWTSFKRNWQPMLAVCWSLRNYRLS